MDRQSCCVCGPCCNGSHTLRHTHYSVCGAAWWWYFILGSMGYSKVEKSMSIALNHLWISYHHTMCLWCGYGVSACLDASICESYSDISVSNMIKRRPFLLLHFFLIPFLFQAPHLSKGFFRRRSVCLGRKSGRILSLQAGWNMCKYVRHSLVALESLTYRTSSDRKQPAQTNTEQPGSRSGHWMIYKCQFWAVMVSICVITGN